MKKAYSTPQLTVHGKLEEITLARPAVPPGKQCSGPDVHGDLRGLGPCGGTPPGQA